MPFQSDKTAAVSPPWYRKSECFLCFSNLCADFGRASDWPTVPRTYADCEVSEDDDPLFGTIEAGLNLRFYSESDISDVNVLDIASKILMPLEFS